MTERITITIEHIEDDGTVSSRASASTQQELLKPEDLWAWLPDAFRAIGYRAMGDDLEKARGE